MSEACCVVIQVELCVVVCREIECSKLVTMVSANGKHLEQSMRSHIVI